MGYQVNMSDKTLWKPVEVYAQDGLKLFAEDYGSSHKGQTPVICLPGLTRTARDFKELAIALSTDPKKPRRVLCIEYRGRGRSAWDSNPANYTPFTEVADLLAITTSLDISNAICVGTSRGGILTMILTAMRPNFIKGAVLNDIGAEIGHMGLLRLKQALKTRKMPQDWPTAINLVKQGLANQFTAFSNDDWKAYAEATFKNVAGKPVLDFDHNLLKTLDAWQPDNPPPSLWPQFKGLGKIPTLVIHGQNSDILTSDTLQNMKAEKTDLKIVEVPGEGHAPALHKTTLQKTIDFIQNI